jgi:hypothetical protein
LLLAVCKLWVLCYIGCVWCEYVLFSYIKRESKPWCWLTLKITHACKNVLLGASHVSRGAVDVARGIVQIEGHLCSVDHGSPGCPAKMPAHT